MKKVIRNLLLSLAMLPLVVTPGVLSLFLTGKTLFLRAILLAVAVCICTAFFQDQYFRQEFIERVQKLFRQPITIALTIFIGIVGISTLFAFNTEYSFFSDVVRQEGFLTISIFYVCYVFLCIYFTKKEWSRFLYLTLVSGAVLLCVEFYQSIKGMDRPDALIGNPIFLATYLLFVLYAAKNVFLTWYTNKQKSRGIVLLVGILAVLSVVGILLTKSRGVILGLVAGVFISLCYLAFKAPRRVVFKKLTFNPQKWAIIFCGVITVFCGTVYVTRTATLWTHVPGINRVVVISKNDPTTQARIINAHIALRGFHKEGIQRKLIGWGQDNFVFMWNKYYSPSLFSFDRAILDRAHNKLIDILVMQGIIGLGAYLGLWVTLVVGIFRMRTRVTDRVLALFLLASYFTANLFAFDTTVTYLFFFFMIAYITVHSFQYEPAY